MAAFAISSSRGALNAMKAESCVPRFYSAAALLSMRLSPGLTMRELDRLAR